MIDTKQPQDISAYMANENMVYTDKKGVLYFTVYALVTMKHGTLPVCYTGGAYLTTTMEIVRNTIQIFLKTNYASALQVQLITKAEFDEYLYRHPDIKAEQIVNNKRFIEPA